MQTARNEDVYLHEDLEPTSAAVIYTSPTTRYHRSATVDLHVRLDLSIFSVFNRSADVASTIRYDTVDYLALKS